MEVWLHGFAFPGRVVELAQRAEAWGFTGLLIADSQNLTADIWVEIALAGASMSRLRLGPGVTNPITRRLAVTASAAATSKSRHQAGRCSGSHRGTRRSARSGVGTYPSRTLRQPSGHFRDC